MGRLRGKQPERTCIKIYKNHRSFKPYLKKDFNERCGYCDAHHSWHGGSKFYQIDHFAPKGKFPSLINEYYNLVYSCYYCNHAKFEKWISADHTINVINNEGFIDPCNDEYENHLERDDGGNIIYKSSLGKYMYVNLELGLERHSIYWNLDSLKRQREELMKLKRSFERNKNKREKMDKAISNIEKVFVEYSMKLLIIND